MLPAPGWVKICGLREPEHAAAAAAAGADLLGFIFAPGRRQVTADQTRGCIAAARETADGRRPLAVGVFVDAPPEEIAAITDAAGLDLVQLHGDEAPASLEGVGRPAIKAVRPPHGASPSDVGVVVERYRGVAREPVAYLIDGHSPLAAGGVGVRADWGLAARLATAYPVVLAGGLEPANVGAAIATVRPIGVDVSSGVEIDGRKDAGRIRAFVAAAREGFAASGAREPTALR